MDQGLEKAVNPLRAPATVLKDYDSRLPLMVDYEQILIARILSSPMTFFKFQLVFPQAVRFSRYYKMYGLKTNFSLELRSLDVR